MGLGAELIREGVNKNNQFRPRYKTDEGNKEVIVGIFILMAGVSLIFTALWI